jgi:uncharacterized membrane protein YcaP (DUF421 family)
MKNVFFNNWQNILQTIVSTTLAYAAIIFLLRISGKRTLTKMNAFDFVVTVALGSALATVPLNKSVTLADGFVVFAVLIFLQAALTWLSVRSKKVRNIITSNPVILLYKGKVLRETMRKERITLDEIQMAARKKGILNLNQIGIIVLETTGDITIIKDMDDAGNITL